MARLFPQNFILQLYLLSQLCMPLGRGFLAESIAFVVHL